MARCSRTEPRVACYQRREAQKSGEMHFVTSGYHAGWKYPLDMFGAWKPPPLYSWTHCPFCDGPLPDAADLLKNILSDEGDE